VTEVRAENRRAQNRRATERAVEDSAVALVGARGFDVVTGA
jgi:hypothetical protein